VRILLINQNFVSPDEPGHTRHFELARFLLSQGHDLVIVGSDINYQTGEKVVKHRGICVDQEIDGVRVIRASVFSSLHRSYLWRILAFISYMLSSVICTMRVKDVDLVMGTSPPIFQAVSAWLTAMLRGKPFLLEVRDLWPEFGISMGVLKSPVIIALSKWLEKFLYQQADCILVNSPSYVDHIVIKGISERKIKYIPYGTDIEMFKPGLDGSNFRIRMHLMDKFLVLYTGALGQANDIYTLLRAAKRLMDEEQIRIVLLGDGKERKALEAETMRLGLNNVLFAGAVPKRDMPAVVAAADVCLAILQDIPMFRTTYPNKVFDYMAAGKPTVLVIDGISRQLIEASGGGVYVPPADDAKLADTLKTLSTQRDRLIGMGIAARNYIVKNLDRQEKMAETLKLMEQLVKP